MGAIIIRGYSDGVNHAFAFAAVHHEGQKRKGGRVAYLSHLANVSVILAKYGQPDDTIVPAILHDVVEDCKAHSRKVHCDAIERKFGSEVLADVLTVTKPETDVAGRKLAKGKSKSLYIEQVRRGSSRAKWICAADKLHNGNCILSDLKRATDTRDVWKRFNQPRRQTAAFYRKVYEALTDSGFNEPIMTELVEAVSELEKCAIRPLGKARDSRSTA